MSGRKLLDPTTYMFHENYSTGAELLREDGRTERQINEKNRQPDKHDTANSRFS